MQNVAHDDHVSTVESTAARIGTVNVLAQSEGVQQGLCGVLVCAVSCVDHGHVNPVALGEQLRCARGWMADDNTVNSQLTQGEDGVFEALALRHRRSLGREIDDIGRETLLGHLEGNARAGGVLVEEVDDGLAPQRRKLLVIAVTENGHVFGRVEERNGDLAREVTRREEVRDHASSPRSISTASAPSVSTKHTLMRSPGDDGRFLPT